MRVLFGAVLCILIGSKILVRAQATTAAYNFDTTVADNFTSTTFFSSSGTPEPDLCTGLDPPKIDIKLAEKTTAILNWTTEQTNINCFPSLITVNCTALENENLEGWQWIIRNSTGNNTVGSSNGTTTVFLQDLSEFTNYTCNATLWDGNYTADSSEIKFRTKAEVSEPPTNLIITEISNSSFVLEWEKPWKNPGVFISYLVHIESYNANHFIPDGCHQHWYNRWSETANETYSFNEAFPDYTYKVTVFLQNSAGNGSHAITEVATDTSASEPPTAFNQTSMLNEEKNIVVQNISWNMPCQTNGKIDHFYIELEGYYIVNETMKHNITYTANATNETKYFKEIELKPASVYNIKIQANGVNETGEFYIHSFTTEDNVPGPPILDDISIREANNFTITWREPERRAGNIINYRVTIISEGPLYEVDPERCPPEELHFNETLSGSQLSYTFIKGQPYYKYKVFVAAATSAGYGNESVAETNTMSSVPEKPENFKYELLDGYTTTGILSWRTPCNINGPMKGFYINLEGIYTEDGSPDKNDPWFLTYNNHTHYYTYSIPIRESYYYEAKVWIVLEDNINGSENKVNWTTDDGYPEAPKITNVINDNHSLVIRWDRPSLRNGRIMEYQINVNPLEPLYDTSCTKNSTADNYTITGNITNFIFEGAEPYYKYNISVKGKTSRGWGESDIDIAQTNPSVPENVQNVDFNTSFPTGEHYDAHIDITFKPPCRANGPSLTYMLTLKGTRDNLEHINRIISQEPYFSSIPLKPEYTYEFYIETRNEHYNNTSLPLHFSAPAGIPQFSNSAIDINLKSETTGATIRLNKDDFNGENGNINFVALILSERNETGGDFSRLENTTWPAINREGYRQLTEDWWNPFHDADTVEFIIGNQTTCENSKTNKNCPLESGKEYYLIIRLFTANFYKNSPTIPFRTADTSNLAVILITIFTLLFFAVLGFVGFFIWRKNLVKYFRLPPKLFARKTSVKAPSDGTTSIPIDKFIQYCKNLENNPEKFAEQYMLLAEKSKEVMSTHTTTFAELTENRRKNRYTNILPYDATRVKLLIDEDDEIGSDYINASYIKGFSGNTEYIATQGPLPTTCRDFWKMVIQENVSIIVMVTQFIEDNKEKCYKYFPNNHESMTIGDDMEVRCTMELHFGTYCVRTIQVKKDSAQVTVTHMQYLDWPDFNVPKGTGTMLQFCHQLRERLKLEGGYVIVHCSAGVGRTGTLIATDILIQNINAGKNIDIFNTVLELRKQRMIMVQAQKQYIYIHNLIRDTLDSRNSELSENLEPLYENQSVMQMRTDDDNLINKEKERESQF